MSYEYRQLEAAVKAANDKKRNTRIIVIVIIIIIVLAVAALIAYIIISKRAPASNTGTNNNTGTGGTGSGSGSCITSSDCPGTAPVCTGAGLCVQCVNDSTCSGTKPVCKTSTNSCVQCNVAADCGVGNYCDTANFCNACQEPVITSFSSTFLTGACDNYNIAASWTSVPGATSYDLLVTHYQSGNPILTVPINGLTGTSILNGPLYDALPALLCSAFNVYINVRSNGPCGTSAFSAPFQITSPGAPFTAAPCCP